MERIQLSKLIEFVTAELRRAEREFAPSKDHVMRFDECELEMAFEVETGGQAGINVWVLNLGGDLKKSETNTIRVKFKSLESRQVVFGVIGEGEGPVLGHPKESSDAK